MEYFEAVITEDDRWCLAVVGDVMPLNIWECIYLENPPPMRFFIYQPGEPKDFDHTGWGAIPVVSRRFADALESIAPDDIQRIPAIVEGEPDGEWEVLNVLARPDCMIHEKSKISYCPDDDPERPGKPRGVMNLTIDPERAEGHHVLRPKDWEVALIVSEEAKNLLEIIGVTGIQFWPVTD